MFGWITVKTIHSNVYFQLSHATGFSPNLCIKRFLVNFVNAGSHRAVWLMTDEVLTERRAGWHAGRRRPWSLRSRPEIAPAATALQHYITADFTNMAAAASCHHQDVMGWEQLEGTAVESHDRAVNRGSTLGSCNTLCTAGWWSVHANTTLPV